MTAKMKQNTLDVGATAVNAKMLGLHIDGFGLPGTCFNTSCMFLTGNEHDCNFSGRNANT
jgi:hypothetical protein